MVTPQEDDMMHIDSCGTDSANPGWAYLDPAVLYRIIDHLQVQDAAAARQACAHWFKAFSKRGSTLALDFPYKSEVVKKVARLSIPIHTVQIACPGKYAPNQPEYIPVWSKALGSLELLGGVTEASICIPFRHKHLSFLVAGLPHLTRLKIRCSGSLAEQMTNNPVRRNPLPGLVAPRPLGNGLCILAQLCDLTHLESDVIAAGDISDLAALTNLTSLVLVLRDLDDDDSESDELSAESSGYSSEGGGGCGDSDAEGSQWGGLARSNGGRTGGMSMSYGSNRFSQCDTHFSRAMSFSSAMSAPNLLRLTIYCLAPLSALVKLETLRIEDDSQGLQGSRLSIAMLQPLEELTWLTSLEVPRCAFRPRLPGHRAPSSYYGETETETIGGYSTHEHEDDGWKDNEPLEPRGSVRWKHKEDHAPRWRELDSGVAVRWKDEEDEQEPGRVAHWEDEEGERDEHALQWKADEVGGSVRWKDEEEQGSKWRDHDPSGSVRWKDGDDEEEGCKWRDSDPSGSVRWKEEEEEEEQASKLRDNEPSGSVRWKDEVSDSVVRWKDKEEEATEWKKTGAGVGLETVGSYGSRMRPSVLSRWSPEGREAMSRPKGLQGAQGVERGTLSSPRVLQGVEGVEKEPAGEVLRSSPSWGILGNERRRGRGRGVTFPLEDLMDGHELERCSASALGARATEVAAATVAAVATTTAATTAATEAAVATVATTAAATAATAAVGMLATAATAAATPATPTTAAVGMLATAAAAGVGALSPLQTTAPLIRFQLPPDEADDAAPLIHFQRPQEEAGGRGCPSPTQGRKRTQPHSSPLTSRSSMKKMGSGGGLEMEGSFGSPMRPSVLPRWSPEDTPLPVGGVGAAGVAEVVGAAGAAKRRPRSDEPSGMVRWKDDVRESVVRWKDAVPESNVQWKDEGPESVVRCKDEEEQASRWKDEEVVGRNESVRPHWSPEDTPLSVGGEGAAKLRPRMPWGDELKADPTDARSEWSRPITYRHTPTSGGGGAGSLYGTSGVSHSSAAWTNVMNSVDHYVCSLPMLEGLRSLRLGLYLDCSDGDEGLEGVQELVESISVLPLVTNVAVRLITHPPDERQVRLRRLQEIRRARSNCRWRRAASIVTDGVGRLASHSEMGVAPPVHQASYVHFASDSGKPPNVAGEGRAGDGKEVRWADELDGAVTDTPFPLCERQEGKTNLEGELVARLGELRPSFLEPLLLQDRVTASIEIIQSQEMK